jgi:methenyltetrahydromethanopterin cyclohydrolase
LGAPFRDLYESAGRDFGKMDPSVFSPAEVVVSSPTWATFRGGRTDPERLRQALST